MVRQDQGTLPQAGTLFDGRGIAPVDKRHGECDSSSVYDTLSLMALRSLFLCVLRGGSQHILGSYPMNTENAQSLAEIPFRTRVMIEADVEPGVRYTGAASGTISPGQIAREVFSEGLKFGRLFAYCFQRFGYPNAPSDPGKDIAQYLLTTPMEGAFLGVCIKAHDTPELLFSYFMKADLERGLAQEQRAADEVFHAEFLAWRTLKGYSLPRDNPGFDPYGSSSQQRALRRADTDLQLEYLAKYKSETGQDIDSKGGGPLMRGIIDAYKAALADLKTPVGVRDVLFSAVEDDITLSYPPGYAADSSDTVDGDSRVAERAASSGYPIPPPYMEDPKVFVQLTAKLRGLGAGSLSDGIANFIATEPAVTPKGRKPC